MKTHAIIRTLTERITSECKPVDREAAFDAMLDECYSFAAVGGPFMYMQPSAVLREQDPTAYRCGVNDYADGEAWVEIEGETYDQAEVEAVIEEFKGELEAELSRLESTLEEMEAGDEPLETQDEVRQQIAEKQFEIAAVEADPFFS